jgi:hypothetical protein
MTDPRNQESIAYAHRVIEETPIILPVVVLLNFQDIPDLPDAAPTFARFAERCVVIATSMMNNLGLVELSRWLDLPLAARVYRIYKTLQNETEREIRRLRSMFAPGRDQSAPTAYDVFWGEGEPISLYGKGERSLRQRESLPGQSQEGVGRAVVEVEQPQEVKEDALMREIVESTSAQTVGEFIDTLAFETEGRNGRGMKGHKRRHRKHRENQAPVRPPLTGEPRREYDTI